MKALTILAILLTVAVSSWADSLCRVYEYEELRGMKENDLQREIEHTQKNIAGDTKNGSNICAEQNTILILVRDKRRPRAPERLPTFEECIADGRDSALCEGLPKKNDSADYLSKLELVA